MKQVSNKSISRNNTLFWQQSWTSLPNLTNRLILCPFMKINTIDFLGLGLGLGVMILHINCYLFLHCYWNHNLWLVRSVIFQSPLSWRYFIRGKYSFSSFFFLLTVWMFIGYISRSFWFCDFFALLHLLIDFYLGDLAVSDQVVYSFSISLVSQNSVVFF